MTPCPGTKGVDVETTISQLKEQGVTAMLCMISQDEMKSLGAESIPDTCQQNNIQWFDLETEDFQVPAEETLAKWPEFKGSLLGAINQGDKVAIHCKGGTGRTGIGAAMLLLELGRGWDQAVADVKALKPGAFSTESMVEFIRNQAENLQSG